MAKKRKRRPASARRSGAQGSASRATVSQATGASRAAETLQGASAAQPVSAAPRAAERATGKETDFASEYRYVLGDLKRIGMLAAAMFATLVVLALVIR